MPKDLEEKVVAALARFDTAVRQSNPIRLKQQQEDPREIDVLERIAAEADGARPLAGTCFRTRVLKSFAVHSSYRRLCGTAAFQLNWMMVGAPSLPPPIDAAVVHVSSHPETYCCTVDRQTKQRPHRSIYCRVPPSSSFSL